MANVEKIPPSRITVVQWPFQGATPSLTTPFLLATKQGAKGSEELQKHPSYRGIIDLEQDKCFFLPFLRLAIEMEKVKAKHLSMAELEKYLAKTIASSQEELNQIKKIHHQLVPLRSKEKNGLKITSKFCVGESSGGEFIDFREKKQEILILLTSTPSYASSCLALSLVEEIKKFDHYSQENLAHFCQLLSAKLDQFKAINEEDATLFEMLLCKIDLTTMSAEGFNFGRSQMISRQKNYIGANSLPLYPKFFSQGHFNIRLERGEKALIISPGVGKNLAQHKGEVPFKKLLGRFNLAHELFNELFFNLRPKEGGNFLNYDAGAILLEVDENVIIKV